MDNLSKRGVDPDTAQDENGRRGGQEGVNGKVGKRYGLGMGGKGRGGES